MPSYSDIANITISLATATASRAGFGTPLILSASAAWVERTREYSSITAVAADFATTTQEYKAAQRAFMQEPRPPKVIIGRLANKPTQRWNIPILSVLNTQLYRIYVDGSWANFTSDGSATNDEIAAGLAAAVTALAKGVTGSAVGGAGSQTVRITSDVAGVWHNVYIDNFTLLGIAQDHADPGVAADLTAIKIERNSFYSVHSAFNSIAMATAIATWVESNEKIFPCTSQDSAIVTTAKSGTDDFAEYVQANNLNRTFVCYHPDNAAFFGEGWAGRCLPLTPGSENWNYKTITGVSTYTLTDTQLANALSKNCNVYQLFGNLSFTFGGGKVGSGEYIDVIRFRDWQKDDMGAEIVTELARANKIPYTDEGIAVIQGAVLTSLKRGVKAGGLAAYPEPKCTVPTAASVSSADKAARTLNGVAADAILAGAINFANITVTITL